MMLLCLIFYFIILIYDLQLFSKSLHMLQQNLYNENNRYFKWIWNNKKQAFLNLNLYGILFSVFLFFSVNKVLDAFFIIVLMSVYVVSYFVDKEKRKLDQNKKPLVITKRIKRLIVTIGIFFFIAILLYVLNHDLRNISILILTLITGFNYVFVGICNIINYPIERMIYHYYEKEAKKKLKSMPDLKVIGITGSYGKTSCKNILHDILKIKYNTLATPKSLNTFNGLVITVNNKLSKFDDIFIAEMGAYVKGEIHGLCELVDPKYAIITSIGTAHLETFGSEENILNGKMELVEYLPTDGIAVLNKDDSKQRNYDIKNNCRVLWIGIDEKDVDVFAKNIECSGSGTKFEVQFKKEKKSYSFETKLFGKHNVYNILSALALGYEFGISIKELQKAVKLVKPVEHRLELKKLGCFYQIDDAYNSNPVGAKGALDVLKMMNGDKVVVTPGMVELGSQEEELNYQFGQQIADVADRVILVGEKRTKPIYEGLMKKKFAKSKITILNDVKEAYSLLSEWKNENELYALFENDLPDTYNEK